MIQGNEHVLIKDSFISRGSGSKCSMVSAHFRGLPSGRIVWTACTWASYILPPSSSFKISDLSNCLFSNMRPLSFLALMCHSHLHYLISLITLFLSFIFFCQKQSVNFPTDYPVVPQSQTWVDLWREGRERRRRSKRRRRKPKERWLKWNQKGGCVDLKSLSPVCHICLSLCPMLK